MLLSASLCVVGPTLAVRAVPPPIDTIVEARVVRALKPLVHSVLCQKPATRPSRRISTSPALIHVQSALRLGSPQPSWISECHTREAACSKLTAESIHAWNLFIKVAPCWRQTLYQCTRNPFCGQFSIHLSTCTPPTKVLHQPPRQLWCHATVKLGRQRMLNLREGVSVGVRRNHRPAAARGRR